MKTNEFQEFVIEVFASTIKTCKDKNISQTAFLTGSGALKGLINHYASMYKNNDSYKNLWQTANFEDFKPLLMSENAYYLFKDKKGSYKKYKDSHKENDNELLYWEHITPNDVIWTRILNVFDDYIAETFNDVNVLKKKISNCFNEHRLLMLTKAEQLLLDRKGGRTGKKIIDKYTNQSIAEQRIHLLLTECNVCSLYLNGNELKATEIFDENHKFAGEVKDYFTKEFFVI